ncbi:MAG: flagella basal body P-ring formation protein FlgA [Gammaproteobacteria bacterium]|nr:MAG: flagella basal body P-ring formation protein FlgA [Gammaproteobacteria bacterium]
MRRLFDTRPILAGMLLSIGSVSTAGSATDGPFESHERIRETARQHVLARATEFPGKIQVTTSPLDSRLHLQRCNRPLESYDSPNGLRPGRNVVGVRCPGSKPWKLYVRVNIATLGPVVVAARPLARGQQISAADLRLEERDTSRLHRAYFTDPQALIGQRARRQVAVGRVLHPGMVERRKLVRRGGLVRIVVRHGALQVSMKGKALENGSLGDQIRVRNTASGREITGEVVSSGVVSVGQ